MGNVLLNEIQRLKSRKEKKKERRCFLNPGFDHPFVS